MWQDGRKRARSPVKSRQLGAPLVLGRGASIPGAAETLRGQWLAREDGERHPQMAYHRLEREVGLFSLK